MWVARVADFGMAAAKETPDWVSTYMWMPPEATGLNKEKDRPKGTPFGELGPWLGPQADVFSFEIMTWMIFARAYRWFEVGDSSRELPTTTTKDGATQEDMRQVARWYFNGERPEFEGISFPPKLRIVVEACWAGKQADRPAFSEVLRVLESPVAQLLEPGSRSNAEPELLYADWLSKLGLADMKGALADCGLDDGLELQQLREYDDDELDEDVLDDEDLNLDDFTKAQFRAAVEQLKSACSGEPTTLTPREAFDRLIKDVQSSPPLFDLVVPTWDEEAPRLEISQADTAKGRKLGSISTSAGLGVSLLDDASNYSGFATLETSIAQVEWPIREIGEEFAKLELPPVQCEWEGPKTHSLGVVKKGVKKGVISCSDQGEFSVRWMDVTVRWDPLETDNAVTDDHVTDVLTSDGRSTHISAQDKYLHEISHNVLWTSLGQRVWVADGWTESHYWCEGTVSGHTGEGQPLVVPTDTYVSTTSMYNAQIQSRGFVKGAVVSKDGRRGKVDKIYQDGRVHIDWFDTVAEVEEAEAAEPGAEPGAEPPRTSLLTQMKMMMLMAIILIPPTDEPSVDAERDTFATSELELELIAIPDGTTPHAWLFGAVRCCCLEIRSRI